MKKWLVAVSSFVLLLALTGCADADTAAPDANRPDTPQAASDSGSDPEKAEPVLMGTTETFEEGGLVLEISNVRDVRTESKLAEGIQPYEETIFTCYPGATLTVVNAGMSDPFYAEDHKAHPEWGLYDMETDTRTRLTDGMEPIVLDETTDGVFNLEASLFVLLFEFSE
ncbi:hypothetical protein [Oscillibacter sp.]|uniref:hypothetical protein n=1 Tax=Oscillibacter sp. TaxID=1945593 RepID=UPI00260FD4BB|nr:hypothetical protein [Oscillibacter sp.]MDD3347820.1 hypothetical protein [Oscillibacter sp.]